MIEKQERARLLIESLRKARADLEVAKEIVLLDAKEVTESLVSKFKNRVRLIEEMIQEMRDDV